MQGFLLDCQEEKKKTLRGIYQVTVQIEAPHVLIDVSALLFIQMF